MDAKQSHCKIVLHTKIVTGLFTSSNSAIKMLSEREDIDLERELHKVYKMFCANQAKLIKMKGIGWCSSASLRFEWCYVTMQTKQLGQPVKGKITNTHYHQD